MERETKEIKTSGGHTIVHKTWLSGREFAAIEAVYVGSAKIDMGEDGKPRFNGVNPNIDLEAKKKLIEVSVVFVDGSKDKVADTILDLPKKEYDEVIEALDAISGTKKN